jgi:protein-disulfide isomerase
MEKYKKLLDLKVTVPVAIIFAGLLIAFAIYYSTMKALGGYNEYGNQAQQQQPTGDLESMRPVDPKADHIKGNPNAKVFIVEYSDSECPFCKVLHKTMNQLMSEVGNNGDVAWVYRQFPLDGLHRKARKEAVAMECAADQGGNVAFWKYTDRLFEVTTSNDGLDEKELPKIAQFTGLNVAQFNTCLTSGKFDKKVEDEVQNAAATGGNGTPWSIVVGPNGKKLPMNGAVPLDTIKGMIKEVQK